jgi:CubicO group peptidase (beta-lactamase class C family)
MTAEKRPAKHGLPVSTPADQGVDARGVAAFLEAAGTLPGVELHSMMLLRHGFVVAAGWWSPYSAERMQLLYSLSKSFTSTAAGLAVDAGLIRLEDPAIAYFPELDGDVADERVRSITVRHLASMASGHLEDTWVRANAAAPDDPVRGFLSLPPERQPGSVFAYNQSCTYTLAAIIQRESGLLLSQFLRPRLLDPLGVGEVRWTQRPAGREIGFSGLHATTDAIARLGQLHLQRGSWEGRRVLSSHWVAEATRCQIATSTAAFADTLSPDWLQGYGFQFWQSRHGYRGDGAFGQFCVVLPDEDSVLALTGQTADMQAVLDAAWEHLLPALRGGTGRPDRRADEDLATRLATLALPTVAAEPHPTGRPASWEGARFVPHGGHCEQQPTLSRVTVSTKGGARHATLEDAGWQLEVPLPGNRWAFADAAAEVPEAGASHAASPGRTAPGAPVGAHGLPVASNILPVAFHVPVACSGGFLDAATARFDVVFLETPHRLELSCSLADGTFEARWVAAPLRPITLREMGAPPVR